MTNNMAALVEYNVRHIRTIPLLHIFILSTYFVYTYVVLQEAWVRFVKRLCKENGKHPPMGPFCFFYWQ